VSQRGAVEVGSGDLEDAEWIVSSVTTKERKRHAGRPSSHKQAAADRRFPVKKTMMLAQQLYEGIDLDALGVDGPVGLITLHANRLVRVSEDALTAVRELSRVVRAAICRRSRTSTNQGRRPGRARSDSPTSLQYIPKPYAVPHARPVFSLPVESGIASSLAMLRRLRRDHVDVTGRDYVFRVKAPCRSSPADGDLRPTPGESPESADKADDDEAASGSAAALAEGDRLELKALRPNRSLRSRRRAHRSTLVKELEKMASAGQHLRLDHGVAAGPRLRKNSKAASNRPARR